MIWWKLRYDFYDQFLKQIKNITQCVTTKGPPRCSRHVMDGQLRAACVYRAAWPATALPCTASLLRGFWQFWTSEDWITATKSRSKSRFKWGILEPRGHSWRCVGQDNIRLHMRDWMRGERTDTGLTQDQRELLLDASFQSWPTLRIFPSFEREVGVRVGIWVQMLFW